jgi:multisubunit Na+/H+ antiporter MnhF subunit
MILTGRLYDVLKWVALVALDAVGVAYEGLSTVWSLPYGDEVLKTCVILSVLIGSLVGVSAARYHQQMAAGGTDD